ncbi:MAG: metallophosphoesterase [Pseudomonadota bacterium]
MITVPFLICLYAYFEALDVRATYVTIHTSKLPPSTGQLTIAQISDVHLGMIIREGRLGRLIKLLQTENPDLIVSTGDLLDQEVDSINHLADLLSVLRPRLGKYAVMGNHEFYAGPEKAADFTVRAGFKLLRNECVRLPGLINIIGVDDPAARRLGFPKRRIPALFDERDPDLFTLFLFHRPPNSEHYLDRLPIDLQLSGHTHGGQLFPFRMATMIFYPLKSGFYRLENRYLYVSRGAGTWGPPLRFLTPPEIVVVKLVRSNSSAESGVRNAE